jgi:uncharacterized protein (TIRG00374 family)
MKKKIAALIVISMIIIVAMIVIADPRKFLSILSKVDLTFIIGVVGLYFINICVKALRWHLLVNSSGKPVPFSKNLSFLMIGLMVNNTTPGRIAGEPVRVHLLRSRANVPVGRGLATIFAERIMDLMVLTAMALIGILFILPLVPSSDIKILLLPFLIVIVAIAFLLYMVLHPTLLDRIMHLLVKVINKISKGKWSAKLERSRVSFTTSFKKGFKEILRTRKTAAACFTLTGLIWLNEAFRIYLILLALPRVDVPSFGLVIIASSAATVFGIALPGGALNAALITMVFTAVGIEVASATTAGILVIMTSIWLSVPLGIIAMFFVGLKIDRLKRNLKQKHGGP